MSKSKPQNLNRWNELMSNTKVQIKSEAQMTKFKAREKVLTLVHFGIHLAFGF